jgi:hypothetical protein
MSIEDTTNWLSERAKSMRDIAVRSSDPRRTASCLVEASRCENAIRLILALADRKPVWNNMPLFFPDEMSVQVYAAEPENRTTSDKILDWWEDTIYSLKQRLLKKA